MIDMPKDASPFDFIFKINDARDLERGAAQAHTALGHIIQDYERLSGVSGFKTEADRRELLTDSMVSLLSHSERRWALATPDEHVMQVRFVHVSAERRPATLTPDNTSTTSKGVSGGDEVASTAEGGSVPHDVASTYKTLSEMMNSGESETILKALQTSKDANDGTRTQLAQLLVRDFIVRGSVEMLVASPPERHFDRQMIEFFVDRATGFDAEGDEATVHKLNLARLLSISNTYGVFRRLDWLIRKTTGSPMELHIDSIPLNVFRLPTNFFELPPTVRKTFTFELTPSLHWALALITVDSSFLPFLPEGTDDDEAPTESPPSR